MSVLFTRTLGIGAVVTLLGCANTSRFAPKPQSQSAADGGAWFDAGREPEEDAGAEPTGQTQDDAERGAANDSKPMSQPAVEPAEDAGVSMPTDKDETAGGNEPAAPKQQPATPDAGAPRDAAMTADNAEPAQSGAAAADQGGDGSGDDQSGADDSGGQDSGGDEAGGDQGGSGQDPLDVLWELARRTPRGMAADAIRRYLEALGSSDEPLSASTISDFLRSVDEDQQCTMHVTAECLAACQAAARTCLICVSDEDCRTELVYVCGPAAALCRR